MALSAKSISGLAGSNGLAAAATARPMSGGRGVASAAQSPIENSDFASNIGVNDNAILHYDDEGSVDQDGRRRQSYPPQTPFMIRGSLGFQAGDLAQDGGPGDETFLSDVLHAIGIYQSNQRIAFPVAGPRGSALNQLL